VYAIFIRDFSSEWWTPSSLQHPSTFAGTGLFPDEDVSVWSDNFSWFTVVLHVVLLIVPMPGLLLGCLFKRKEDSEEVLFVLATASALALIGSQINSIRYLGLVGAISAALRCYEIGAINRQRDRLI